MANRPESGEGSARAQVYSYKLVLLGDTAVGKSSIVLRFIKGQFYEFQESTIGAAFLTQALSVGDATVNFEIWDTAGQERFHSLAPMYYRGAAAAVVAYDITSMETFERAKGWVKELQRQGSPNVVIALAGNKTDLEPSRKVNKAEAKQYADETGLLFIETSAKDASNINDLFLMLAKTLPKSGSAVQSRTVLSNKNSGSIVVQEVSSSSSGGKGKKDCC